MTGTIEVGNYFRSRITGTWWRVDEVVEQPNRSNLLRPEYRLGYVVSCIGNSRLLLWYCAQSDTFTVLGNIAEPFTEFERLLICATENIQD